MRARLGFSIATSVEPDILLLDEVLATGDADFRVKSKARVLELVRQARAIVLVTHDMSWVTEYCNRAILLEHGRIVAEGEPAEVVEIHREHSERRKAEKDAAGVLTLRSPVGAPRGRAPTGLKHGLAGSTPQQRPDEGEGGAEGEAGPPVEQDPALAGDGPCDDQSGKAALADLDVASHDRACQGPLERDRVACDHQSGHPLVKLDAFADQGAGAALPDGRVLRRGPGRRRPG